MILTPAQRKAYSKALAAVNAVLPKLELLKGLSEVDPNLKEMLGPIISQKDYLFSVSTLALELADSIDNGGGDDGDESDQ